MNRRSFHIRVLFILYLLLPAVGFGQNMEDLAKHAKRFVSFMEEYHFRPRTLDNQFGQDVHGRLLEYMDENKAIFLNEDIINLVTAADSLDEDIIDKKTRYANLIVEIYKKRVEEARKIVNTYLSTDFDVYGLKEAQVPYTGFPANASTFKERWEKYVLSTTQYNILMNVNNEKPLEKEDVKKVTAEAKEKTREYYNNYFTTLSKLELQFELIYVNAIALAYDPHSSYFNEELRQEYSEELNSSQFLFGITYAPTVDGEIEITEILPGSSAWFADDLKEGVIILGITSSTGQSINAGISSVREISTFFSELNTDTIYLEIKSEDGPKDIRLVRSKVYSDNDIIKSAMLKGENNIGYISLPDFYANWTDPTMLGCSNDVAKSLLKLKSAGMDGLILDLRNNGGGSLDEAVDLIGIFINFGPVILLENRFHEVISLKDSNKGSIYDGPLIVLINSESASASEIVAGSLQDYNRALIVGQPSFGKATGQAIFPLDPKMEFLSGVSVEDPSWGYAKTTDVGIYRLSKTSAQQKGIVPDIITPHFSAYIPEFEKDMAHSIVLDSVDKQLYFTPKPAFKTDELKSWYLEQLRTTLNPLAEIIEKTRTIDTEIEESLDLEKSHLLYQQVETLSDEFEKALDQYIFDYQAESFQFDESIVRMSPFLQTYSTDFIQRLMHDVELNEAYKIMEKFIAIHQ